MRSRTNGGPSRRRITFIFALAASTLALMACQDTKAESPQAAPSKTEPPAATEVARIGAKGSACEMPITIGLAESWKPKAVNIAPDHELAALARQGPMTVVCEIDAKPAGSIGFLRVWTGDKAALRPSLEAFIGAQAREPVFTELQIGGRPALEVVYQQMDQLDEVMERKQAFVVETERGIAAVSLESMDDEERADMLPAYELAKRSLTVTS